MYSWTEFNLGGRYLQSRSSGVLVKSTDPGVICVRGIYDHTYYLKNGDPTPRPKMPLSIKGTTVSGIPEGAVLKLGDQSFTVDDGCAEIKGYSGTVKLSCWPYLDAEVEI